MHHALIKIIDFSAAIIFLSITIFVKLYISTYIYIYIHIYIILYLLLRRVKCLPQKDQICCIMHQCINAPMHQCTNAPMHQCINAPMHQCINASMLLPTKNQNKTFMSQPKVTFRNAKSPLFDVEALKDVQYRLRQSLIGAGRQRRNWSAGSGSAERRRRVICEQKNIPESTLLSCMRNPGGVDLRDAGGETRRDRQGVGGEAGA